MTERPTNPDPEYGERPGGAPAEPQVGERPEQRSSGDALDAHRDAVVRILARGEDMSAAAIATEVGLEATQVSSLLTRLERDGQVTRKASGSWRAERATQAKTEPQPSPKEPEQGG